MDKSEKEDKIIVFKKFESVMAANLAKTKLDAYGIPCYLTNETFSSLYPLPFMKGVEVCLYIFETDSDRVYELIQQEKPQD
jgi:hypothetical protein